ncbi:unnamed protein product [Lota lota]
MPPASHSFPLFDSQREVTFAGNREAQQVRKSRAPTVLVLLRVSPSLDRKKTKELVVDYRKMEEGSPASLFPEVNFYHCSIQGILTSSITVYAWDGNCFVSERRAPAPH